MNRVRVTRVLTNPDPNENKKKRNITKTEQVVMYNGTRATP